RRPAARQARPRRGHRPPAAATRCAGPDGRALQGRRDLERGAAARFRGARMSAVPTIASPLLSALPGVRHAFFTRQGGVSEGVYASLNVGRGSGDEPDRVAENRARAAAALALPAEALSTCYQIHSAQAVVADAPLGLARPQGDAVATRTPGVLCGALA